MPYPFCDYQQGATELCDLDIMLNNSFYDAVDMDTYSDDVCANLVSDCRCGFCGTTTTTDEPCSGSDNGESFDMGSVNFWVGFLTAVLVMAIIGLIYKFVYVRHRDKNKVNGAAGYTLSIND